jgi:hypothetical protein
LAVALGDLSWGQQAGCWVVAWEVSGDWWAEGTGILALSCRLTAQPTRRARRPAAGWRHGRCLVTPELGFSHLAPQHLDLYPVFW